MVTYLLGTESSRCQWSLWFFIYARALASMSVQSQVSSDAKSL